MSDDVRTGNVGDVIARDVTIRQGGARSVAADKVVIRMASYQAGAGSVGQQLAQAGDVGSLDASTAVFRSGLLTSTISGLSDQRSTPSPRNCMLSHMSCIRSERSGKAPGSLA